MNRVSICARALAALASLPSVASAGEYASLKDRPYYDEVIQKLREVNEQEQAAL